MRTCLSGHILYVCFVYKLLSALSGLMYRRGYKHLAVHNKVVEFHCTKYFARTTTYWYKYIPGQANRTESGLESKKYIGNP